MTNDRLTDKERALIEAAKRQAAARRAAAAGQAKPNPAVSTPLDQPTVLGWDNPAANPKRSPNAIDPHLLADWPTGPRPNTASVSRALSSRRSIAAKAVPVPQEMAAPAEKLISCGSEIKVFAGTRM